MNIENLFIAWWLVFGSKFEEELGFSPTNKEVARHAFEAGGEAGQRVSKLKDEGEHRSSQTELTLENAAKLRIGIDGPDALLIQVEDGYAIQALPHEEHYIVLQVRSTDKGGKE